MNQFILTTFLSLFFVSLIFSQVPPPDPCDDGSQATCQCENSPVLCTIDDLDGFEYSMSSFQHPEDGPEFLCDGEGVPNNPTWFSFVAWCEDLSLEVELADCSDVCLTGGPCNFLCNLAGNCASGVQIAIYGDCDFNEEVACIVDDCNNEDNKVLSMSELTIGKTYHFVIDGCGGSACDFVRINVLGTCGLPQIEAWDNPMAGPDAVCVDETTTYNVDSLDGANLYTWFLDGLEIGATQSPSIDVNWPEEGNFTLCVEPGSERCPVTDGPDPLCKTVEVYKPQIDSLLFDTNPLCPGEEVNISAIASPSHSDLNIAIIITDRNSIIQQIDNAAEARFTFESCDTFIVNAYQYRRSNVTLPEVGDFFSLPDCSQLCCDLIQKELAIVDQEAPDFIDAPADTSYNCINAVPQIPALAYEDNCQPDGFVEGIQEGLQNFREGDSISRQWTLTDVCGNEALHQQTIRIREGSGVEIDIVPATVEALFGENLTLEVTTNLAEEDIASVLWTPPTNLDCTDCLRTSLVALVDEEYTLTVTDQSGCSGEATFQLLVRQPDIDIFIPNIFTPDGDGINDGFTLFTNAYIVIEELAVYDRWGQLIFESRDVVPNDPSAGWDGRSRGQLLPNGVYIYSFLIKYPDGSSEYLKGAITLTH